MASKQAERQQRNKRTLAMPHEHATDPWSFLEVVDAPQWVDLSLEAMSTAKDGFDPWFGERHKHHAVSLAGLNSSMSWVHLGKSWGDKQGNQSFISKSKSKGYQAMATKLERNQSMRHLKVSDNGHSTKIKDSWSQKGPSCSNSSHRTSSVHLGSVDIGCTFSGSSITSEYDPGRSVEQCSLCSDISSATISSQVSSVEPKSVVNVRRGSSKWFEDSYGTPTCRVGTRQRSRSSSNVYLLPKSSYSSESGSSTCTRLICSELGVSTSGHSSDLVLSQSGHNKGHQFSEDSVSSVVSGASSRSHEQGTKGCVRILEGASPHLQKVGELEDIINCNKPSKRVDLRLLGFQLSAKETVKSGFKVGRQRFVDTRATQVGSLPKKQPTLGKENAHSNKSLTALQVKDRFSSSKAPLAVASSKTANAKCDERKSLGESSHVSQGKKLGHTQAAIFEEGVPCPVKTSFSAQQRNRAGSKQLPVAVCTSDKTRECERDLAALVALHNQKLRVLRLQDCRKGLR